MGIQFTLAIAPATDAVRAQCYCGGQGPTFTTYDEFRVWLDKHMESPVQLPGCTDQYCLADVPFAQRLIEGEEPEYMEVSVGNQRVVLETLGYSGDEEFGEATAEELEGRMLMALAVAPESAEIPTWEEKGEQGCTMIHCARPAGYVQSKLLALQPVIEQAKRFNRSIIWG